MQHLPAFLTDLQSPIPDPMGYGEEAVQFISSLVLESGEPFDLHPVQERIIRKTFGDVDENGDRKTEVLYLHLPSGQAKSTLAAAITLMLLSHKRFRIQKGQCVVAASTKEQAGQTTFGMVEGFIRREFQKPEYADDPDAMARRFKIISNQVSQQITHIPSGSTLRVLSRTPDTQEGLSVYALIAEETHAWNRPRMWPVLRKSQAKVSAAAPIAIIATTAGVGHGGIGFDLYSQAKEIASGKVHNESWLPIIYEAAPEDDWKDPEIWRRCNFALGSFKSIRTLRNLAKEAETSLTARREFERYHLNRWHDGVADSWLDLAIYEEAADGEPIDLDRMKDLPGFIGIDVSSSSDLTAVVAVFKDEETLHVLPFSWVPAESIAKRSEADGVPYIEWASEGFIEGTEGASIDEDAVEQKVRELCAMFDIRQVGFDPWNARRMAARLGEDGIPVVEVPQTYAHMSPAMKRTEAAILDRQLKHYGHPVLRWCFSNVPMPKPDPNGNIKPSKSQARSLKVDLAVATMIGVYLADIAEVETPLSFESITGLPSRETTL
jgi:phage terminase large subunit-like protein